MSFLEKKLKRNMAIFKSRWLEGRTESMLMFTKEHEEWLARIFRIESLYGTIVHDNVNNLFSFTLDVKETDGIAVIKKSTEINIPIKFFHDEINLSNKWKELQDGDTVCIQYDVQENFNDNGLLINDFIIIDNFQNIGISYCEKQSSASVKFSSGHFCPLKSRICEFLNDCVKEEWKEEPESNNLMVVYENLGVEFDNNYKLVGKIKLIDFLKRENIKT